MVFSETNIDGILGLHTGINFIVSLKLQSLVFLKEVLDIGFIFGNLEISKVSAVKPKESGRFMDMAHTHKRRFISRHQIFNNLSQNGLPSYCLPDKERISFCNFYPRRGGKAHFLSLP